MELGTVDFPISCNADAQAEFNHGVTLLHSFFLPPALASFEKVVELDPSCAMGHWGQAMTHLGIPWSPTPPEAVAAGSAAVEAALATGAPSPREEAYINAVALLYQDADTVDFRDRIMAYEVAMEELAQDFPDDVEAQVFYSLALNMTGLPAAEGFPKQLKATEVALPIFAAFPNHPGAAHYLIHSHDFPPLAEGGLEPALVYAQIAPAAPHAQHMPSHIFTRLGYWQESIDSNTVGVAANKAAMAENHPAGTAFEGALHGTDYMMYAHLNLGQDEAARAFIDEINGTERVLGGFGAAYALAAMPARYVMERGAWEEGAALTLHPPSFPWENFPQAEAIMVTARGVSAARAGDVEAANAELAHLQELQAALNEANQGYWAGRADIQIGAVTAWIALAEGDTEEALTAMRGAAELDAVSSTHPVSPGNLVPAYELLGEMLLELDQPAEALTAFETSMEKDPNRFRSYFGAARAAELAGDADTAKAYYEELVNLAANGDGERAELMQAQAFLGQ